MATTEGWGGGSWSAAAAAGGGEAIAARVRGTSGQEQIRVTVNGTRYGQWTIGTGMGNWLCRTSASGSLNVSFINDAGNRDVRIDYVSSNGSVRPAESRSTNTGVHQNGRCGGSYSEWLHRNGYIGFGYT